MTLLVIPVIYAVFERRRWQRVTRKIHGGKRESAGTYD